MSHKCMYIKKLIFILLTITALCEKEVKASGRSISLMRIEREIIISPSRDYHNKLDDLSSLRTRKNELRHHNQRFSQKQCFNTKSNLNADFDEKNIGNSFSHRRKNQALIIGGGQSSLAIAYFLRRYNLEYTILDSENGPGGAWQHGWDSLRLFSPAQWSSLPGWSMPPFKDGYPSKSHIIHYLTEYERRYNIPIQRPVKVKSIRKENENFVAYTDNGEWESQILVSATGKWSHPFIPDYLGKDRYRGKQIHSAFYQNPEPFKGHNTLIVGGGNSGAQILAEVSKVAKTTWVTLAEPLFLPDDVDGRVLFERATERWKALQEGRTIETPKGGLGDIVMVPSVKEARARHVLKTVRPFRQFNEEGVIWQDGIRSQIDSVIWCTGFSPALEHLHDLGVVESDGKVRVQGTRSIKEPNLWLVGYGDWVGYASATLVGVTRTARDTSIQIAETMSTWRKE